MLFGTFLEGIFDISLCTRLNYNGYSKNPHSQKNVFYLDFLSK